MTINNLYTDLDDRLNTVIGEPKFWPTLARMKLIEFGTDPIVLVDFVQHVLITYGIQIYIEPAGTNFINAFDIKDEQKFLFFLLKYST